MEKVLALVAALNSFEGGEINKDSVGIMVRLNEGTVKEPKLAAYFIKTRPYMTAEGVEDFKFIARKQK